MRPGVPMTTCTPARRRWPCSSMLLPPTTLVALKSVCFMSFTVSVSICCASSRVGAMMMARGPSSPTLSSLCGGDWSRNWMRGMTNAAVLPEPVSAMPIMSRRWSPTGMAWRWMGLGFSKPMSDTALSTSSRKLDSLQKRSGSTSRPPQPLMRMSKSSRKMRQSRCSISSSAFSDQCLPALPIPRVSTDSSSACSRRRRAAACAARLRSRCRRCSSVRDSSAASWRRISSMRRVPSSWRKLDFLRCSRRSTPAM
mmetsp:Transcript_3712/g.12778  ORF Transcript_3712/g.12778 Transcript_3712/m.12778 type:complete len:254 (-) Transcript_3712:447-1208(-)